MCLNIVKRKNSLENINHSKIRSEKMSNVYKKAGVDVEKGYESVERMKKHVDKTTRPEVIGGLGAFAGLFDLSKLGYKEPVLVSGTDGVGTKLMLAFETNKHDTIGIDLVAMCVNDIVARSEEHTSELQSRGHLVCRLLLEKKN